MMNRFTALVFFLCFPLFVLPPQSADAQTPCAGGEAGGYPCKQIELLSHVDPVDLLAEPHEGIWLNDIWGWTDPETGKEYAIVGMANGTSFVDVSDPLNPLVLGILPEHHAAEAAGARTQAVASPQHDGAKSIWRDMKVYKNHAYIVSEDAGHGVQVFDLTNLRNVTNPPQVFRETANYQGISNAHNIVINEETGFAFAVGATAPDVGECNRGGLHMIDIRDPANPVFAGCYDEDGYTHDAHCVVYEGSDEEYVGREICFSANEDAVTLVDVSDKENPFMISTSTYEGVGYVHQGWLTEDHRYFISNDELDELRNEHNTRSYIWDMQDLDLPVLIGTYTGPHPSIDHNLYIQDGLVYESNYTSGLRVLSLEGIENGQLREVAYFDTHPTDNARQFLGSWSNYPFFESGTIVVSDITNGLFVLRLAFDMIQEQPQDFIACLEGEASFSVETMEGVTYQWQLDEGSGFANLENNELYSQVNSADLLISSITEEMQGNRYRVKITEEDGAEHLSEAAELEVTNEVPQAFFDYRLEKGGIVFTNQSENASSFLWEFGNGTTAETVDASYFYEERGEYEVTLTALNGCGTDSYSQTIQVVTAVEEEIVAKNFKIFPNPTTGLLSIKIANKILPLSTIRLFDAGGRELFHKKLEMETGQGSVYQLDLRGFKKGIYVLQLQSPATTVSRRLILKE